MIVKIKLASNYQTLEFDLDVQEEEDGLTGERRLNFKKHSQIINDATAMIERIGELVNAGGSNTTTKQKQQKPSNTPKKIHEEEMATDRQIYTLEQYGIDARGMTKKEAWETLNNLRKEY